MACTLLGSLPLKYLPNANYVLLLPYQSLCLWHLRICRTFFHGVKYLACFYCTTFCIIMLHQCINLLNTLECYESIQAFIYLKKMLFWKSNSQVRYFCPIYVCYSLSSEDEMKLASDRWYNLLIHIRKELEIFLQHLLTRTRHCFVTA